MIVHRIPYPPDKGDKIRSYHELQFLKDNGWNIHLCTFIDDPEDEKYADKLKRQCATSFFQRMPKARQKLSMAMALFSKSPLSIAAFFNQNALAYINQVLDEHPVRAVFCFSSPTAEYIFQSPIIGHRSSGAGPRLICDFIDVDSDKWRQYAQKTPIWLRWVYLLEARRLAGYERKITEAFDVNFAVSEPEAALLREQTGQTANIHALSNGVDLDYFQPASGEQTQAAENKAFTLVFCGLMDYYPNVDAVGWFVQNVWPLLNDRIEDLKLLIVGANPAKEVLKLEEANGIHVSGRVQDIRPYVWRADIAIAPMRIARGIQNKVLEAMAMGKPVVATSQAFEGIEAEPGRDLMVTDADPHAFAQKIIELWQDKNLAAIMGANARNAMIGRYSWHTQLEKINTLL